MRALGDKIEAKRLAEQAGVPVAPWSGGPVETRRGRARATRRGIGFPLMIKAAAGGGGRGIRRVDAPDELAGRVRARARRGRSRRSATPTRAHGAPRRRRAPRRGAADRRRPGRRVGARRARLLLPAPPPEGRRGVRQPGARRPSRSASSRDGRACGSRCAAGYRNAGTVEFLYEPDERPLLVHGGQHPPAGRAPRHRGGHRRSTSSSCSSTSPPAAGSRASRRRRAATRSRRA